MRYLLPACPGHHKSLGVSTTEKAKNSRKKSHSVLHSTVKTMERHMTKGQLLKELGEMREQLRLLDTCRREMHSVQMQYERLLESAPDAMLFVNREGRIVSTNAQLEHLFGYSEQELVGEDLHILIPERFHERHREELSAYFSDPRPRSMGSGVKIDARRKDGTEFPADISLSPLEADGEMLAIASIRDITERRRNESRIERNYLVQSAISAVLKNSLEPITLDEQMNRALDLMLAIPELSPQARGSVYLVEDEPDILVLKAFHSSPDLPPLLQPHSIRQMHMRPGCGGVHGRVYGMHRRETRNPLLRRPAPRSLLRTHRLLGTDPRIDQHIHR